MTIPAATSEAPRRKLPNIVVRTITGLTLLPVILLVTGLGGWVFAIFVMLLIGLATLEFYHMERQRGVESNALIGIPTALMVVAAFQLQLNWLWALALGLNVTATLVMEIIRRQSPRHALVRLLTTMGGLFYLAFPAGFLLEIRSMHPFGLNWLFTIFFATWGADTMAYLAGRAFGKTPLAPRLSPKKTVEGAIGGIIGGIFFPCLTLLQIEALNLGTFALLCVAPFVAIFGDLFESGMKRFFGVKDSNMPGCNPFPGHGGVLDRVDSLLLVSILFYAFLAAQGMVGF